MRLLGFLWPALPLGIAVPWLLALCCWPTIRYEQLLGEMVAAIVTGLLVGLVAFLRDRRRRAAASLPAAPSGAATPPPR